MQGQNLFCSLTSWCTHYTSNCVTFITEYLFQALSLCFIRHILSELSRCLVSGLYVVTIFSTFIFSRHFFRGYFRVWFNPLKPNDPYRGRTAPLTSKRCILYISATNIRTEYFKHGIYSPFFPLQNAVCFIILTYLVPVLFTFYIQCVLKI